MKKIFLALLAGVFLLSACQKEITEDEKSLNLALAGLKNTFLSTGKTRYQINLRTNKDADPGGYDIRLILPGKTLGQIAFESQNQSLLPSVRKNLKWAKNYSRRVGNGLCYQSDESGATAIMLLLEMFYEKASGNLEFAPLKKDMLTCLKESFYNKEYGFRETLFKDEPHPFYDGETWLALAVYTDFFPEDVETRQWVEEVDKLLMQQYRKKDYEVARFFHWGAQAAAQRYKTTKNAEFLDFLKFMFDKIQKDVPVEHIENNMNACTYSEGLADLIDVVKDKKVRQTALERLYRQIQGVHRLQLTSIRLSDGSYVHPDARPYVGLFYSVNSDENLLPDTAQHCAMALFKATRLKPYQKYAKKKNK